MKNNKGFMILETLIVSCIVLGVLIYMYTQFRNININYQRTFKYNTVSSLYKTNEIKKFIEEDAYLEMFARLKDSNNDFYDITQCDALLYNSSDLCDVLYQSLGINKILIMPENLNNIKNSDLSSLDNGLQNFIKYLANNYEGYHYRLVVSYNDGTYGTVKINNLMNVYEFNYTGNYQEFVAPVSGNYKIELWGASGGDMSGVGYTYEDESRGYLSYTGGNGAYTSGEIFLEKDTSLYIYVGGTPLNNITLDAECVSKNGCAGGYNGGGSLYIYACMYGAPGGGATDIRLVNGLWDNFDSLKSRIMVAAGGGGANFRNYGYGEGNGGSGGTLIGFDGQEALTEGSYWRTDYPDGYFFGEGGKQNSGGNLINHKLNGTVSTLLGSGRGLFGKSFSTEQSGGGAGYYNGSGAGHGGGGGGSSFISGYTGCDAITETSTESNIVHTGTPTHYSGKIFTDSTMIAGNTAMPNYNGGIMTGNDGNGYARISFISQ